MKVWGLIGPYYRPGGRDVAEWNPRKFHDMEVHDAAWLASPMTETRTERRANVWLRIIVSDMGSSDATPLKQTLHRCLPNRMIIRLEIRPKPTKPA